MTAVQTTLRVVGGAVLLTGVFFANPVFASVCVDATPELAAMERRTLIIDSGAGGTQSVEVYVADSRDERAAGFQHLCHEVFAQTAILFVFENDSHSAFHMSNVHGPLDIAFIDADGLVVDLVRMEPYGEDPTQHILYGASQPFRYALEMEAGRFAEVGVAPGSRITLP